MYFMELPIFTKKPKMELNIPIVTPGVPNTRASSLFSINFGSVAISMKSQIPKNIKVLMKVQQLVFLHILNIFLSNY